MDSEKSRVAASASAPDLVFVSYSHADTRWVERLRVHLKPLERHGGLTLWDDTRIQPGSKWKAEIREAIDRARVAVLFVSADFLASEFITTNELPPLLHAARERGTVILSLIVKPCRFEQTPEIAEFQAVNSPSEPLVQLRSTRREQLFVKIAGVIEEVLKKQQGFPNPARVGIREPVGAHPALNEQRTSSQSAEFEGHLIRILDSGTVEVELRGKPIKPSKPALRSIAGTLGLSLLNGSGKPMNTRQLGARIVRHLCRNDGDAADIARGEHFLTAAMHVFQSQSEAWKANCRELLRRGLQDGRVTVGFGSDPRHDARDFLLKIGALRDQGDQQSSRFGMHYVVTQRGELLLQAILSAPEHSSLGSGWPST